MSREKIDNFLWNIEKYLMKKYGVDAARDLVYPLAWYIDTGRASCDFLHAMLQHKPYTIARVLAAVLTGGGSMHDVITNIKKKIGLPL